MKKFKIQNVSGAILAGIILITLIILAMFYFGGETPMEQRLVADTSLSEPAHTDALIYWIYVLSVVTVVVTLLAACFQFFSVFKDSPKSAIRSLLGVILLVALLLVTYSAGDTTPLKLIGYDGSENVPFWLKMGDMFIYTIGVMLGILVLLMLGFGISKRFK